MISGRAASIRAVAIYPDEVPMAVAEEPWSDPAMLAALSVASVVALTHDGTDATARLAGRWTDSAARASLELLEVALLRAAVALVLLDGTHRIAWANAAACTLLDRTAGELLDVTPDFLIESAPDGIAGMRAVWTPRPNPHDWREFRLIRRDDTESMVLMHCTAVYDDQGQSSAYLLQLVDPTRRPTWASADDHHLLTDPLTGLPTPPLLMDRLQTALARSERAGSSVAVVRLRFTLADTDRLSRNQLNPILVAAARRLRAALRATDTVACAGRDGFTLICEDVTASQVRIVADRVVERLGTTFKIDGRNTPVLVQSGVAVGSGPLTTNTRLLEDAEAALESAGQPLLGR
jgi:GGDEF domain-containing protein